MEAYVLCHYFQENNGNTMEAYVLCCYFEENNGNTTEAYVLCCFFEENIELQWKLSSVSLLWGSHRNKMEAFVLCCFFSVNCIRGANKMNKREFWHSLPILALNPKKVCSTVRKLCHFIWDTDAANYGCNPLQRAVAELRHLQKRSGMMVRQEIPVARKAPTSVQRRPKYSLPSQPTAFAGASTAESKKKLRNSLPAILATFIWSP